MALLEADVQLWIGKGCRCVILLLLPTLSLTIYNWDDVTSQESTVQRLLNWMSDSPTLLRCKRITSHCGQPLYKLHSTITTYKYSRMCLFVVYFLNYSTDYHEPLPTLSKIEYLSFEKKATTANYFNFKYVILRLLAAKFKPAVSKLSKLRSLDQVSKYSYESLTFVVMWYSLCYLGMIKLSNSERFFKLVQ